jgi:hypothetical protein
LHWSLVPEAHAEHVAKIHPALLQKSWWGFILWTFIVRPFVPGAEPADLSQATVVTSIQSAEGVS